jgi:hypothetical protein
LILARLDSVESKFAVAGRQDGVALFRVKSHAGLAHRLIGDGVHHGALDEGLILRQQQQCENKRDHAVLRASLGGRLTLFFPEP